MKEFIDQLKWRGMLHDVIPGSEEYLSKNKKQFSDWIYFTICLVILIQFFPIKSSGSFFSTYNSAFTFLILGIALGVHEAKNSQIFSKEIIN